MLRFQKNYLNEAASNAQARNDITSGSPARLQGLANDLKVTVWFAHGSNLKKENFRGRFSVPAKSEKAILPDYAAYFYKLDGNDLVQKKGAKVFGAAYWLKPSQLQKIDEWKKILSDFETITVSIEVGNREVQAFTQVLTTKRTPVQPSPEYLETILEGLREHGRGEEGLETWRRAAKTGAR